MPRAAWAGAIAGASLVASLLWPAPCAAAPAPAREVDVKAALIYDFTLFVEWPAGALPAADEPFVIGVVSDEPLADALELAVRGKRIHDHAVVVRRWHAAEDALNGVRSCPLLVCGAASASDVPRLLGALAGAPTLTVGDLPGFARGGGMIELYLASSRVRFEINPPAATAAGLKVSSKLLGLARLTRAGGR